MKEVFEQQETTAGDGLGCSFVQDVGSTDPNAALIKGGER